VLLLEQGKVSADGVPLEVAELFYRRSNEKVNAYHKGAYGGGKHVVSSGEVELVSVNLLNERDQPSESISSGGMLRVRLLFTLNRTLERPEIIVGTHTTDFLYLSAASTALLDNRPMLSVGTHEVEYIVPSFPLVAGPYCIRFAVFDEHRRLLFSGENLKTFTVLPIQHEVLEAPMRKLNLPTQWRLDGVPYSAPGVCLSEDALP
jgi:hypothetical protein